LEVAYQALKTPLPDNWKRACIKNSEEVLFINIDDNTIHGVSPIDEAAIIHYQEQKEKLDKQKQANAKIIPKARGLPPIKKGDEKESAGPKKLPGLNTAQPNNENVKREKSKSPVREKSKSPVREKSKSPIKEKGTPVSDLSKDEIVKTKEKKAKMDNKKENTKEEAPKKTSTKPIDPMANLMPNSMAQNNNKGDIYNIPINTNFGEVQEFKFPDNNNQSKASEIGKYNSNKKGAQKFNVDDYDLSIEQESTFKEILKEYKPKQPIAENNNHNSNNNTSNNKLNNKSNNDNEKKDYYKTKTKELKEFEIDVKERMNKGKNDYKNKKLNLTNKLTDEYSNKLNKAKREFDNIDNDPEIIELKRQLEKDNEEKLKAYRLTIENQKVHHVNEDFAYKTELLNNEKQELQEELEKLRRRDDLPVNEINLKGARDLLNEKFEIDKNNLNRKYENLEREMNLQEEDNHNKDIENIKNHFETNLEMQEKLMNSSFNKILEDFQKTLEDDFNIQTKAIMSESQKELNEEFSDFEKQLEREKEEKHQIFNKEMGNMEKAYSHGNY
jgi:hypothetical protein